MLTIESPIYSAKTVEIIENLKQHRTHPLDDVILTFDLTDIPMKNASVPLTRAERRARERMLKKANLYKKGGEE